MSSGARADADPWWAYDKAEHLLVCTGISSVGTTLALPWVQSRWVRMGIGFGAAVVVGAGKELWDLSGHGDPSWKDFTWDVIGAATGALIATGIEWFVEWIAPEGLTRTRGATR